MNDDENPFAPPSAGHQRKYVPSKDPSVLHEPHLLDEEFLPDENSELVHQVAAARNVVHVTDSAWDEPSSFINLAQNPSYDAASRASRLNQNIASLRKAWFTAGLIAGGVAIALMALFRYLRP